MAAELTFVHLNLTQNSSFATNASLITVNVAVLSSTLYVGKNFTSVEQIFISSSENSKFQVLGTATIAAGHIMIQGDQLQL